jgi:hypothetical protein
MYKIGVEVEESGEGLSMEDFEGNVARTISRYHTHMNKYRTFVSCDVYVCSLY